MEMRQSRTPVVAAVHTSEVADAQMVVGIVEERRKADPARRGGSSPFAATGADRTGSGVGPVAGRKAPKAEKQRTCRQEPIVTAVTFLRTLAVVGGSGVIEG
jgi:hypothetical protein